MSNVTTGAPLRVLLIEDVEDDAVLLEWALSRGERVVTVTRVETLDAVRSALQNQPWDVIIADHRLPGFTSFEVLQLCKELMIKAPCIVLSSAIGEEATVQVLKAGAADVVSKNNLARVPLALERALSEARTKRERQAAHEELKVLARELQARNAELEAILDAVPAVIWIARDPNAQHITGSRYAHEILRMSYGTNLSKSASEGAPAHFRVFQKGHELAAEELPVQRAARGEVLRGFEEEILFDDGTTKHLFGHAVPLRNAAGAVSGSVAAFIDVTELKQHEQAQRQLEIQKALAMHVEAERRRIGQELHDGVRQQLTGIQMLASNLYKKLKAHDEASAKALEAFTGMVGEANQEVRRLISGLVPVQIDGRYLGDALVRSARQVELWYGITCQVVCQPRLKVHRDETAHHLYHMAQEAMTNAAKHSHASIITLQIKREDTLIILAVQDDGVGLPDNYERRGGMGIQSMRHRAELIGGTLSINSKAGSGTVVTCTVQDTQITSTAPVVTESK